MADLATWLDYSDELIKFGYSILGTANVPIIKPGEHDSKIVAACLLSRTLSNMRGVVLLATAQRVVESRVLARCCFENQFWVAALAARGQKFIDEMVSDEIKARQTSGHFMVQDSQGRRTLAPEVEDQLRSFLRRSKKEWPNANSLNPSGVAKSSEVASAYIFYRTLSADAAHASISSLNRYVRADKSLMMHGLDADPAPDEGELAETLNLACLALLGVCVGVTQIFDEGKNGETLNAMSVKYLELSRVA
jgi:hypothetical protein